ncbi:MAG: hypothetical protein ABI763_03080 [Bacteroidota bacterium]
MKVLLDIKDSKATFMLELLRSFSFVKAKPLSNYKAQVLGDLREAVEELKLVQAGKKKARNAQDFLNEL